MWLFKNPKNFPEMNKKIAWTTFLLIFIVFLIGSKFLSVFSAFMYAISFKSFIYFNGQQLFLAYLYFPLIFALLEIIFNFHEKLSELFSIKFRFDKDVILSSYISKVGVNKKVEKIKKRNVKEIMSNTFYKYAEDTTIVDSGLVKKEMGLWSWYWITIYLLITVLLVGIPMLIFSFSWFYLLGVIVISAALYAASFLIKKYKCSELSTKQVSYILENLKRKVEIKKYLSEI